MQESANAPLQREFDSYQWLLRYVIHSLNIRYSCPLDRLSRYSNISFARLDEARRARTDRKQVELTQTERIALVCTCFDLGAPELGLLLVRFGISDWVECTQRSQDRETARKYLDDAIANLNSLKANL